MESNVYSLEDVFETLKHIAQGNTSVSRTAALTVDDKDPFLNSSRQIEIRKFAAKMFGNQVYVRRVYANFEVMSRYRFVGWVFDSDMNRCMVCGLEFGFFNRKHHCRVCGDLVCASCSEGEVLLAEYTDYGCIRACDNCNFGQNAISVYPLTDDAVSDISTGLDSSGSMRIKVPQIVGQFTPVNTVPPKSSAETRHDAHSVLRKQECTRNQSTPASTYPRTSAADSVTCETTNPCRAEEAADHVAQTSHRHRGSQLDWQALEEARRQRDEMRTLVENQANSAADLPPATAQAENIRRETAQAARIHREDERVRAKEYAAVRHTMSSVTPVQVTAERPARVRVKKRSICGEVERMTSAMFGSLKMMEAGSGIDSSSNALMSFADDPSGELHVWQVCGKQRVLVEVQGARRGVFQSTGCYAILYRCKNGARNILFLWVGAYSSPDIRAALAIQSVRVVGEGIAADHVQVAQGREPPLLLAICMVQLGHPLVVVNDPADNPSNKEDEGQLTLFSVSIEVCVIGLGLRGQQACAHQVAQSYHINDPALEDVPTGRARVCIGIDTTHFTCQVGVILDKGVGTLVKKGALRIADVGYEVAAIVMGERIPDNVTFSQGTVQVKEGLHERKLMLPSRPVRLFRVSSLRRDLGAIFVEEIGAGAVFAQADLQQPDCFVLDGGCDEIFLWFGRESSWHSKALCLRVATAYLEDLRRPHDPSASLIMKEAFGRPASSCTRLVLVECGDEPAAFVESFRLWVPYDLSSLPPRSCVHWDPAVVSADDTGDAEIGSDGLRIDKNAGKKPRYSDTHVYKRSQRSDEPARGEYHTNAQREDFRSVQLHRVTADDLSVPTSVPAMGERKREDFRTIKLKHSNSPIL